MGRVSLIAVLSEPDPDASPLIASLRHQTDPNWELILVDTTEGGHRRVRAGRDKHRVRVLTRPGVASGAGAGAALREASGDLIGVVDPSDVLARTAIATFIARARAEVDLLYSDEDRITADGNHVDPFYKPGWSPDRLRCQPYTGRLTLVRHELVDEIGGVRTDVAGAYEWDLVLRVSERARGVEHIAEVLCHRPVSSPGDDRDLEVEERRVLEGHLDRTGFPGTLERGDNPAVWHLRPQLRNEPLVSIVVPTAGRWRMVHGSPTNLVVNCIEHLVARSTYSNYEIVCVAGDELDEAARAALRELAGERVRFVANPGRFNFSRAINLGALHARGGYLLLLNDDTQVITPDWIEAMLMYGQDAQVGAVGVKLLFADGRLQHGGIISVGRGAGHPCYGFPGDYTGHADHLVLPANYLAVTGACLLTRRDRFEEVGGFATQFPLNYNDVDYCLKLHHRGHRVVFNPEARLYHFELSSRVIGTVVSDEYEALDERWGAVLRRDPYYNPNFIPSTDFLPPIRSLADVRRAAVAAPA